MVELKITLNDNGQIQVTGPIDDPIVSYGLLGVARDIIAKRHQSKSENRIVPATIVPPNGLSG